MKQNKYDDPDFFSRYSAMPRSTGGLAAANEWPAVRDLLPDLAGKRVLDLGCGFGWHCRYAREAGARSVVGVDLSSRMLDRARATTDDPAITYVQSAIEDIGFDAGSFDVVLSSLALHYVEDFDRACARVAACLVDDGAFVFSVEHPVFTAREAQDWHRGAAGEISHWPVDDYQREGRRHTRWMADDVVKYHRTVATTVNTLIDNGFRIARLLEPQPTPEAMASDPALADELRRPMFMAVSAVKSRAP